MGLTCWRWRYRRDTPAGSHMSRVHREAKASGSLKAIEDGRQLPHEQHRALGAAVGIEADQRQLVSELIKSIAKSEIIARLDIERVVWHAHTDGRADLRRHARYSIKNEGPGHGDAFAIALANKGLPVRTELMNGPALVPTFAASVRRNGPTGEVRVG